MNPIPVIVSIFNRPDYTQPFLENLYQTKHGVEIFPIFVNNGSRKATTGLLTKWVEQEPPQGISKPHIIFSEKNKGFAGGINLALEYLKEQRKLNTHICILHNDTLMTDNCLKIMVDALNTEEDIAIVIPQTNYANEMSPCLIDIRRKFEEVKISNKHRATPDILSKIITETYGDFKNFALKKQDSQDFTVKYCPEISSFCMLVKEGLFIEYGFFNEDFWPRGYEDKFWFAGLQMDGWVCTIANDAYVHHYGNITSDGPGFCFPDIMRINEIKFKEKMEEKIKKCNKV